MSPIDRQSGGCAAPAILIAACMMITSQGPDWAVEPAAQRQHAIVLTAFLPDHPDSGYKAY